MKRIAEYKEKRDRLIQKRVALEKEIKVEADRILDEDLKARKTERIAFFTDRFGVFFQHKLQPNDATNGTSLFDALVPPIYKVNHSPVDIILHRLGPYELSIFMRVSRKAKEIVASCFPCIAESYFKRILDDNPYVMTADEIRIAASVGKLIREKIALVDLNETLALLAHFFRSFRGYRIQNRWPTKKEHIGSSILPVFLTGSNSLQERPQYVPLYTMPLFTTNNYEKVTKQALERWSEENPFFGKREVGCKILDRLNASELASLELQRVTDFFDPTKVLYLDHHNNLSRLIINIEELDGYLIRYVRIFYLGSRSQICYPFLDLYELRFFVNLDGETRLNSKESLENRISRLNPSFF